MIDMEQFGGWLKRIGVIKERAVKPEALKSEPVPQTAQPLEAKVETPSTTPPPTPEQPAGPSSPLVQETNTQNPETNTGNQELDWNHIQVSGEFSPSRPYNEERIYFGGHFTFKADNTDTLRQIALLFGRLNQPSLEENELNQVLDEQGVIRIDGVNINYYEDKPDPKNPNVRTAHLQQVNPVYYREPSERFLTALSSLIPREQMVKSLQLDVPTDLDQIPEDQYRKYIAKAIT